ncbi:MAG: hypothetical protein ACNA7U_06810 [Candidatus Izemoplasmataceae bacterium]|jgi:hypothetical protein|uniref:hypothetical protein n=1 Tax=Liberiplasma polymorphum TaxID=3374570 RepID=UPI00377143AE
MKNNPKTLISVTLTLIFIVFLLTLLKVGELTLLIPLNLLAFSLLFFALSFRAVKEQIMPQAKRLLIIGITFFALALIVFIFGQIL